MKTIFFEGDECVVEDWVSWVARDSNGEIYGYAVEPTLESHYWYQVKNTKRVLILGDENVIPWHESKAKVQHETN